MIATKLAGRPLAPSTTLTTDYEGLSAAVIRESSARSRERLGVSTLDLLYAHGQDPHTPLEETVEAFGALVDEGSVGLLGVSNHWSWRVERCRQLAAAAGIPGTKCCSTTTPTRGSARTWRHGTRRTARPSWSVAG